MKYMLPTFSCFKLLSLLAQKNLLTSLGLLVLALGASSCSTSAPADTAHKIYISVDEQKMLVLRHGEPVKKFPVSTSRFGLGDTPGSNRTPLGKMRVEKKIGGNQPKGMVFKGRKPTGEVLKPNAPGRDPIVTRILWLRGMESKNRNTFGRYIYIHGTPEESKIGQPASFGCVRMTSRDVISLYNMVGEGAQVEIIRGNLPYRQGALGNFVARDEQQRWNSSRGNSTQVGISTQERAASPTQAQETWSNRAYSSY